MKDYKLSEIRDICYNAEDCDSCIIRNDCIQIRDLGSPCCWDLDEKEGAE